jgi:hypothetical protein
MRAVAPRPAPGAHGCRRASRSSPATGHAAALRGFPKGSVCSCGRDVLADFDPLRSFCYFQRATKDVCNCISLGAIDTLAGLDFAPGVSHVWCSSRPSRLGVHLGAPRRLAVTSYMQVQENLPMWSRCTKHGYPSLSRAWQSHLHRQELSLFPGGQFL